MVKALHRHGLKLTRHAAASLRTQICRLAGPACERFGFFVLAADGSRFELPRTASHHRVFGAAGKPGSGPQLWCTMLWQMSLGLPCHWRIGRARASERHHLRDMLDETPAHSLLVMDAGFTGYGLLRAIVDSGRDVLVRASKRVELLTQLGYAQRVDDQTVYLWPSYAQRQHQPPLVLRLIRLPGAGDRRRKVYLLTSVRDPQRLSDEQAGVLYRLRWGVELGYHSLKQTLERRKLRSHGASQALFEMHGMLLGLMLLGWMSVHGIVSRGGDPLSWSLASALRIVRRGLREPSGGECWLARLADAVKDGYRRVSKVRVDWPRKKQADPPPGRPELRRARRQERVLAQQLQEVAN